eukprot:GFUD01004820.1.p1 GENE.GFUD01004820.1~~GFUD01004820.1.p1  ORF type:complete len:223 (-),score=81.48 GFUD01004820.1:116-784(-)
MVKELMTIEMERDTLQQKWGITIQGGADLSLTAKIASVKRFSPADRAGLEKMDYIFTVNGKEVFNMTQPQINAEVVGSKLKMVMQVERGTFIVPSFDEIWPQAGKERSGAKSKRMGIDYILEAMQHHGLGHLPQPDNFTTCGRLGIEVNQYNNPIECYADETIDDMREEKVIVDHPELAEKMLKGNKEKHNANQVNPMAAQKARSNNWDPKQSSVLKAIHAQ